MSSSRIQAHEHMENLYLDHACQCCIDALQTNGFRISPEDSSRIRNDLRRILTCTVDLTIEPLT